jgi:hypothetical protein
MRTTGWRCSSPILLGPFPVVTASGCTYRTISRTAPGENRQFDRAITMLHLDAPIAGNERVLENPGWFGHAVLR